MVNRKCLFHRFIPSIAGPDRPDVDDLVPAHNMESAVEIDGRIAMRGEKFDGRAELGSAIALEIQGPVFVAHEAVAGAGWPAAERHWLAAVGREGPPPGIHHHSSRLVRRHDS